MVLGLVDRRQIRAARGLLAWTQKDLGAAIGVDQRLIRYWERRLPSSPKKRERIRKAFEANGVVFLDQPIGVGFAPPPDGD